MFYHPRSTLAGLFRQMSRYGKGRVRLLRKHPDSFSPAVFLPAAFLCGVAAGSAGRPLWHPLLAEAYAGVLALYALVVSWFSVTLSVRRRAAALLPLLPLVFAAVHAGAGWGVLSEAIAGRKPARPAPVLTAAVPHVDRQAA